MRVDIFCESGEKYGLGHFYRCLKLIAICGKIPQVNAITLHNRGDFTPPPFNDLLDENMQDSVILECKNYEWLSTQPQMLDVAIVDSYETQEWFYYRLKSHSKALICLDDTLRDVYPPQSYILNQSSQEHFSSQKYHLWCGQEYIIPPIILPEHSPSHTHNKQIFISFGGVDSGNLTQEIVHHISQFIALNDFAHCHFHIVLGNGYTHQLSIPPEISPYITLYSHLSPKDFLHKASVCDYAISAGGGSMLELIMLKIPSIIIESAPNQRIQITQWEQAGAIALAQNPYDSLFLLHSWCENMPSSYNKDTIKTTLHSLSLGTLLPKALSTLFAQVAESEQIQSHNFHRHSTQKDKTNLDSLLALSFNELTQEESHIVLSMRNHEQVARWMYATHITPSSHHTFLQELKNDHSKRYWLFKYNGEYIGVGSLTRINLTHKHAFIGIYTNPFCTQSNKGKRILTFLESFATQNLALHTLHLEVLSHNERALRFYEKCNYIREGVLRDFILCKESPQRRYYDVILMYKECQ